MISALLYLQYHSLRNRLVSRIRRLRKPKYLAAALVGGAYLYFYFFRFLFHSNPAGSSAHLTVLEDYRPLIESLGALALFIVILLSWLIPHERAALTFTEAEVAFLFPAPVSRRGLIHYKLLRSQFRILISAAILALFSRRFGGHGWTQAAGWWLIFSTLNLHLLGSSFARTMLLDRGLSNRLRRLLVAGFALAGAAVVILWARRTLPEPPAPFLADWRVAADWAGQLLDAGPALVLLYPFRLVIRPFLAPDVSAFCLAAVPALLVFLFHYIWVIRSNVAFEEASVEASQKLAASRAAGRAGNWDKPVSRLKGRKPLFRLAPEGPRAIALFWKNLISARQVFSPRIWLSIGILIVFVLASQGDNPAMTNVAVTVSIVALVLLVWMLLIGPHFFRQDFRQDLALADLLKSFPLRGWQVALGELLAPAVILTFAQWLLLGIGAVCLWQARQGSNELVAPDRLLLVAIALSAGILLPLLDLMLLVIPNAAVLLFPSWIPHGPEASRGFEAIGQRIIYMFGQLLVFALTLVPAALVFLLAFFVGRAFLGDAPAVALGSLGAAIVLAAEAALGVLMLGRLFERFDLSEQSG